ncbi:MAG: hypothetical protein M3Q30_19625 [Actinomycetota bacterium]|nr:hypothetical protein [Actinomycetota bacterium]
MSGPTDREGRELRDLLNECDPIGVYRDPSTAPSDRDEYDDLNGSLLSQLRTGATSNDIRDYLLATLRDTYGLTVERGAVSAFAEQLTAWFGALGQGA